MNTLPIIDAPISEVVASPQLLTDALIANIATAQCGWSKKQLQLLGVDWPPPSGWRQRLVAEGRILSAEQVTALYDARKKPKRTDADPAEIAELPCPWCGAMVRRVEQGGNVREFCTRKHKTLFNTALTAATIEHARLLRTPRALKTWTQGRVHPSPGDGNGLEAPLAPSGASERQGSPLAASSDGDTSS